MKSMMKKVKGLCLAGLLLLGATAAEAQDKVETTFSLAGVAWRATAGAVPWATTSYGTTGFAVTNLALRATKDIKVTDTFAVPVFAEVSANPCSQKAYLVLGLTLQP